MKKNHIYVVIIVALIAVLGYQIWRINSSEAMAEQSENIAEIVMYKNAGCQCCDKWAAYMEASGYSVIVKPTTRLSALKMEQGVPYQAASCHTVLIDGYVVEGHVPVEDVKRLLKDRPDAIGIAVPGMPAGSPGMPSPNPEPFNTYLIGNDGSLSVYAQHNSE